MKRTKRRRLVEIAVIVLAVLLIGLISWFAVIAVPQLRG